ncbi:hypothetical protein ACH4TQ_30730 [Streptomyces sp. NPDC021218]|uniref:hypothetical protein n=1 Tax=Streptomyces sp. NPDC021218 TaxID=3365119 RepID=UPI00379EC3E0
MQCRWTNGSCWLWCERSEVLVLWLGPVQWEGGHAPLYACRQCLRYLETKLLASLVGGGDRAAPGRLRWARSACWLWCEQLDVPTLRVGVVERADQAAPLHVCASCMTRLEHKVRTYLMCGKART